MPVLQFNGKLVSWEFGADLADKKAVIQKYNEHNEEALRLIPKDRLLVYNVKDGWEPLCNFLQVPVPSTPLPKSNTKEDFRKGVIAMGKGGDLIEG